MSRPTPPEDTVYEVWEHKETGERVALRLVAHALSGVVFQDEPGPPDGRPLQLVPNMAAALPGLPYHEPGARDAQRMDRDRRHWIVIARYTDFVSATPPPWVLARQAVTRRTVEGNNDV